MIFVWLHRSMNSVSSRRLVMKGSRYPLMMDDFWMGMMIRVIRLSQGTSWMMAASSISPDSCIMEFRALRLAKGMYLIVPAMISSRKVLYSPALAPNLKNATPTASAGIRYGRKATLLTYPAHLLRRFLLTQ